MHAEMREGIEGRMQRAEKPGQQRGRESHHRQECQLSHHAQARTAHSHLVAPAIRPDRLSAKLRLKQDDLAGSWPARAYWNAVSEKLLSLRECRRSIGISASFSIAL